MNELARRLARRIRTAGPLTLADYMAEALGHPELGYYRKGDPLGAAGDFITAPEISQMFGEMIGLWLVERWERIGSPDPVILVELGPGRGTLMADALRAARVRPDFGRAARLHLVESSPGLRERQRHALAAAGPAWHDRMASVPEGPLLLVANEFFDALPVRQFERVEAGWCERLVGLDEAGTGLRFLLSPPTPAVDTLLAPEILASPPGTVAEVAPLARTLASEIGARLAKLPGVALLIDYGDPLGGLGDTLQAVRHHQPHDPLDDPGEADLTAHVDFAALTRAATEAGARVWGPVTQGAFLGRLGIEARADALSASASPRQATDVRAALQRLIDPAGMGSLFAALAMTSPGQAAPAGFETDGPEAP